MITILQVLNTKLDLLVVNSEMHLSSAGFQKQNAQAEFASSLSPDSRKILGSGVRWGEGEQHDGVQRAFENGTTEASPTSPKPIQLTTSPSQPQGQGLMHLRLALSSRGGPLGITGGGTSGGGTRSLSQVQAQFEEELRTFGESKKAKPDNTLYDDHSKTIADWEVVTEIGRRQDAVQSSAWRRDVPRNGPGPEEKAAHQREPTQVYFCVRAPCCLHHVDAPRAGMRASTRSHSLWHLSHQEDSLKRLEQAMTTFGAHASTRPPRGWQGN